MLRYINGRSEMRSTRTSPAVRVKKNKVRLRQQRGDAHWLFQLNVSYRAHSFCYFMFSCMVRPPPPLSKVVAR